MVRASRLSTRILGATIGATIAIILVRSLDGAVTSIQRSRAIERGEEAIKELRLRGEEDYLVRNGLKRGQRFHLSWVPSLKDSRNVIFDIDHRPLGYRFDDGVHPDTSSSVTISSDYYYDKKGKHPGNGSAIGHLYPVQFTKEDIEYFKEVTKYDD